jgi:antitoxin (DNA-binding transcriptional repressor) of toxin-antitoxin stability system
MDNLIGLKDLRLNMNKYVNEVKAGKSFIVLKQSKAIFKLTPIDEDENWEEVVNFAKIKKGGVNLNELLEII